MCRIRYFDHTPKRSIFTPASFHFILFRISILMKNIILCLVFLPSISIAQQSFNMTLLSNYDIPGLPVRFGASYSDCWGFNHSNGTEIAIVGGIESIFFFNITSPANPVLIYTYDVNNLDGTTNQSLWRDFKTYQNYVYAVSDEEDAGLLIFDLSNVPTSVTMVKQTNFFWNRAHNIFIDVPNARLYATGPNTLLSGMKILDLSITPANPSLLGSISLTALGGGYVHDVYVRNHIAYCSHGGLHKLQMYNMANLSNVTLTGLIENYPEAGYNHSSWLNDAGTKLVMADETQGSDLKLVDITDPMNISADDIETFYSELEGDSVSGASIAHNPFVKGDLAYLAYYHDGVQVFNISDHENIELLAYYDTYPLNVNYTGYEGCWGVYPYLPSGMIIASDQTFGLYVMQITNQALDIEFLAFDAFRREEGIQLRWSVAEVTFGNRFEVKRSEDNGVHFETVASVNLIENVGHYQYLDQDINADQRYIYRIDFVELDGNKIKSPLRSVTAGPSKSSIRIINPITSNLVIDLLVPLEFLELQIFDMEGRLVWRSEEVEPAARIEKKLHDLVTGHYMLTASWPENKESFLLQIIQE